MRRVRTVIALLAGAVLVGAALAGPATVAGAASSQGTLTPIVVSPLTKGLAWPVIGTDGQRHVLYELAIVNTQATPVTIDKVDVRVVKPRQIVATFTGADLASRLRRLDGSPLPDAVVAPGEQVFMLVDVALFAGVGPPRQLEHRITLDGTQFIAAPIKVSRDPTQVVASPVHGKNWVVTDGCCSPESPHRAEILPTAAGFSAAARYAVDLRQMDELGRFVNDDPTQLASYPSYGQYVSAVGPGEVVSVVDGMPDQVPGTVPPDGTFTAATNEGNTVVIALRDGNYALYGGLEPGSIIVKPGSFVRRDQPIAKLGNSANGDGPHLHFELMSGPSALGADGVPFVFSSFSYAGEIDAGDMAAMGITGDYASDRLPIAQVRQRQLPLRLSIVDFQQSSGASGSPLA